MSEKNSVNLEHPSDHKRDAFTPPSNLGSDPTASQKITWLERNIRNKPQSNSIGGAGLLFIIAGMNMAWSASNPYRGSTITWYIGAIIGSVIGAVINMSINRKYLMMFSSMLTIIDGVVYITFSLTYYIVNIARFFDGLAIGFVFVPIMVLIGEESVKHLRGMLSSSVELMCFYAGIAIQVCFDQINTKPINSIQIQGILNIVFGLIALAGFYFMYIESPIKHLLRGEEESAIDCLRRLQSPPMITIDTYEQLEDHKRYLEENTALTHYQSMKEALPALSVLIFYRVWVAVSFSALTYHAVIWITSKDVVILYGNLSFISALIASFLMDTFGRRRPTVLGSAFCSCIALSLGLLGSNVFNTPLMTRMLITTQLLMVYQFVSAFSTLASLAYLTEAFPLLVKTYFICIPFIVQMIVQLIINCNFRNASLAANFYCSAAISLIMTILASFVLPETKKVSLVTAQNMFKKVFSCRR